MPHTRMLLYLWMLCICSLGHAQTLQLVSNESAAEQAVAALLLTDIYRRAGLTAAIQPLPASRANMLVLNGSKDGEVARVEAYAQRNPALTKVEPSYYYLTTVAYARSARGLKVTKLDDLRTLRVGIVQGIAHAEAASRDLPNVQMANSYESLYAMLRAGRFDVLLDTGANGSHTLRKMGITDVQPVGEVARHELFHMLSPAHSDLAPRISRVIRTLKDSGQLVELQRRYEKEFLNTSAAH